MKNRLRKSSLKVLGFEFVDGAGRKALENLVENDRRRYPLLEGVYLIIYTNQGNLHVKTLPGFEFDGRSGPRIIDWYVPNLGNLAQRICWLVHDVNGYAKDLSFKDTNVLLYAMLRDLADCRTSKANVIQLAVSVSDSWYGDPKPDEWCYKNRNLVESIFMEKCA